MMEYLRARGLVDLRHEGNLFDKVAMPDLTDLVGK